MEKLSSIVFQNAQMLSKLTGDPNAGVLTSISPCNSIQELHELEEKLKNAREFTKMARALSVSGGRDDGEATRRIISSIVGHELALQMNWVGSPGKRPIVEFPHVIKLIATAVTMDKRFSDVTQLTVENHIKRWLRCAADRQGGRNKRLRSRPKSLVMKLL